MHMLQLPADQKTLLDSLELELQGIVSLLTWVLGTRLCPLQEVITAELFLHPSLDLLNVWGNQAIFAWFVIPAVIEVKASLKTSLGYLVGHT